MNKSDLQKIANKKFNPIKVHIATFKSIFKASYNLASKFNNFMVYPESFKISDNCIVPLYKDDDTVKKLQLGISIIDENGNIWTDNEFEALSEASKKFCILHELGHANDPNFKKIMNEYKNTKGGSARIRNKHKGVRPEEVFADKFAYDIMGKDFSIKALLEMGKVLNDTDLLSVSEAKELLNRIEILETYK